MDSPGTTGTGAGIDKVMGNYLPHRIIYFKRTLIIIVSSLYYVIAGH